MRLHGRSKLKFLMDKWFRSVDIIGLIDGSRKSGDDGISAGIGGYLIDKSGKVLYFFYGPTSQTSAYNTELEALIFLLRTYFNSEYKASSLAVTLTLANCTPMGQCGVGLTQ